MSAASARSHTSKASGLKGLRVVSFESRRSLEMAELIADQGGEPLVAPSLREIPLTENKEALAFGRELISGKMDMLILLTGVGARVLLETLFQEYSRPRVISALSNIKLIARGPKVTELLKQYDLESHLALPEPSTWREILELIDRSYTIKGLRVAIQEYGISNLELIEGLRARGAKVISVPVYRWALPEDTAPLRKALEAVIAGRIDVAIFTNAHQLTHVMAVAKEFGLEKSFREALSRVAVASVGPNTSECLDEYGFPVDIEATEPKMNALIADVGRLGAEVIRQKKSARVSVGESPSEKSAHRERIRESLFMKACRREPVDRTPIWLMRQAGRYMKNYRELRAKTSFLDLCKNPELAAGVTLQAVEFLGVDAAIIFSDILLILEPLGLGLSFGEGDGPMIHTPVREAADVKRLREVDVPRSLGFVLEAIRLSRAGLPDHIPLLGFSGAPFTLASYMIEGQTSRTFVRTKSFMHGHPEAWHALMERVAGAVTDYLNAQIEAGVDAVQLFDSWVGCLAPHDYRTYVLPHVQRVIRGVKKGVPVIHFGTQTSDLLELMKEAGGDVIGLDWRVELDRAWARLGNVAIQGNLDPTVLFSDQGTIKKEAERILKQAGGRPGYIFNLGHGVLPETPVENVHYLIEIVKKWKPVA